LESNYKDWKEYEKFEYYEDWTLKEDMRS